MSISCFDREDETFVALINHEEQYSIWPRWKKMPVGRSVVESVKGDKKTVLWTDMRSLSLSKSRAGQEVKKQADKNQQNAVPGVPEANMESAAVTQ